MSLYIWILMCIVYGSLYGSYMDPTRILDRSIYESPKVCNCYQFYEMHELTTHEALTIRNETFYLLEMLSGVQP